MEFLNIGSPSHRTALAIANHMRAAPLLERPSASSLKPSERMALDGLLASMRPQPKLKAGESMAIRDLVRTLRRLSKGN